MGCRPASPSPSTGFVRESLTNAQRHAVGATGVEVHVERRPGTLDVVITDDGKTSPTWTAKGRGFGLVGMAERVQALGGTFAAGPTAGAPGWEVRAAFPTAVAR